MSEKSKPDTEKQMREDAHQALRSFEHILEIMPDDCGTLEGAVLAAGQAGDLDKELAYRIKLADLLVAHGDETGARVQADALRALSDPRARAWVANYDVTARRARNEDKINVAQEKVEWSRSSGQPAGFAPANISDEIDLAFRLQEQGLLSEEEYASLVKDLTDMASARHQEPVSVLHALENRHHKNLDNILSFISQAARAPFVSLSCFAMRAELLPILSEDFIISRGSLPFETLGKEILVAVMNPFSATIKTDIETRARITCHLFLARASEFEEARKRLRDAAL